MAKVSLSLVVVRFSPGSCDFSPEIIYYHKTHSLAACVFGFVEWIAGDCKSFKYKCSFIDI